MKIQLDKETGRFRLEFAYRKELVAAIKELADRRYDPSDRSWSVGFDKHSIASLLSLLAGNKWPTEQLNQAEEDAEAWLRIHPNHKIGGPSKFSIEQSVFDRDLAPNIQAVGRLVVEAYMEGKITQKQQMDYMAWITHLSLKDFIK